MLESELFGHEKGAFTGAAGVRKGKFEAAEDGTLFLDEIGEMAPLLQSKLLRVLQQREFERLGGNRLLPFNARVVAATNKNLEQAIKAGEFRQDLYYRLNVVSVASPPLREHREDIPLLALYFANKYAAKCKRGFKGIAPEARSLLMQYSWPGNVRELENAIEHAIVMGLTDEILPEDLPNALLEEQSSGLAAARYHDTLNQTKKQLVLSALDEAKRQPGRGCAFAGNSSQVSAPFNPEFEFEDRREAGGISSAKQKHSLALLPVPYRADPSYLPGLALSCRFWNSLCFRKFSFLDKLSCLDPRVFSKCRRRYSCSVSGLIETISITLVSKRRGEPLGPSKLNGDSLHSSKSNPSPEGIDLRVLVNRRLLTSLLVLAQVAIVLG